MFPSDDSQDPVVSQKRASIFQGALRVPQGAAMKKVATPKKETAPLSKLEQNMESYFSRQQSQATQFKSETPRRFPMPSPARRERLDFSR